MKSVEKIEVGLDFGTSNTPVGELVIESGGIYFRYYPAFIASGIAISPFELPLNTNTHIGNPKIFEGLFGVFNDSLPDGWGRLLTDRSLSNKGISLINVSPLDRLSYVGAKGMGALTYLPINTFSDDTRTVFDLDEISMNVLAVLEGDSGVVLDHLRNAGGSSGGARPKVFAAYNPEQDKLKHGMNEMPSGFEEWLIKFPSSTDDPDIAKIEMAYYKMACQAGIKMSESRLFESAKKQSFFGTKRFDRIDNKKLHLHSASGLVHDDFRTSQLDYGHLLQNGHELTQRASTYEEIFRLMVFNVYAHNRDDHSKNFSFLMNEKGDWEFAPAYDLTLSSSSHGMHSTAIAGESENPSKRNFMQLAETFLIKKADKIIEEVKEAIDNWEQIANSVNLPKGKIKSSRAIFRRVQNND
jgi:serine/threonine-protein kinase HipA